MDKFKVDPILAKIIDSAATKPYTIKLKWQDNVPATTKIAVRKAFNKIKPEFDSLLAREIMKVVSLGLDYETIEQHMAVDFKAGKDLHLETAKRIWPGKRITKAMRRSAKVINYYRMYGGLK